MGGGSWNTNDYRKRMDDLAARGVPAFGYSASTHSLPRSSWTVHEDLDPHRLNAAGQNVREARDSAEHPNATPIAVLFDVTGSMHEIPQVLQTKLAQLQAVLQRGGVSDPQILMGAIGDEYSDQVPLQIGQFESDIRLDEQLRQIFLEGNGGGGNHESYQLAMYYMARHAELDCLKRGRKGYLFIIGDERVYARIDRERVAKIIGDQLPADLSTAEIVRELQRKFEVFFLFASQGSYEPSDVLTKPYHGSWDDGQVCYWRDLLGQNALVLDDAAAVCETIAMTIGLLEGTSQDEAVGYLRAAGAEPKAIAAATRAVALVTPGPTAVQRKGDLPPTSGNGGTTRL